MNIFDFTLPILTSSVTKIFKHILKVTQGKGKMKRSSLEKKEDIKAMMIVESIEKSLSENSNVLMEFLLNHMTREKI
jgi:hypothetical protein